LEFCKIQDDGGHHLERKVQKSRYPRNGLMDLYEIWYSDAKWVNFKNRRWRTAGILKTIKSPYLCNRLTDVDKI